MRSGKRPTMYEKVLLKAQGHNSDDYLRIKRENKKYTFVHRSTGKILTIEDFNKR
ncbi:hypothetical protein N4T77_02820 [Clostridium sp. CX1]|uniref:DUF6906 family protein n=1 Tax=Clostridium sp. CX1 TaxID=2978346 RepID=UPI0021C13DD2|nr:hypothetical protein [Clostridium sp. CX1]MCT8975524.1 hypothetical protein [Clostridium sp. CX1]